MRLVKDRNPGAYAIRVRCVGREHGPGESRMVNLARAFADLDGRAFVDYYCDACVAAAEHDTLPKRED